MTEPKKGSDKKPKLKDKYVRSVIKLGNSKAITFPQDWAINADLVEKSEVSLYPLDEKTIIIRAFDKESPKTIFRIFLIRPVLSRLRISAYGKNRIAKPLILPMPPLFFPTILLYIL